MLRILVSDLFLLIVKISSLVKLNVLIGIKYRISVIFSIVENQIKNNLALNTRLIRFGVFKY